MTETFCMIVIIALPLCAFFAACQAAVSATLACARTEALCEAKLQQARDAHAQQLAEVVERADTLIASHAAATQRERRGASTLQ